MIEMKNSRSCFDCKHFEIGRPYSWGTCNCPLPVWVDVDTCRPPVVHPTGDHHKALAESCDCYQKKDSAP